jgi:hypothetical protein
MQSTEREKLSNTPRLHGAALLQRAERAKPRFRQLILGIVMLAVDCGGIIFMHRRIGGMVDPYPIGRVPVWPQRCAAIE